MLRSRAPTVAMVLAVVLASAAGAAADGAAPLALPRPGPHARPQGFDPVEQNARCEECHADIAAEWRASQHRTAWSDPVFQAAYAVERETFCRDCHAPEYDSNNQSARHLGVGCVTCHVQGETKSSIVGARALAETDDRHAVAGDARMANRNACAACHQFEFLKPQDAAMQSTLEEHADSPYAAVSCQSCHMPKTKGAAGTAHKSHRFRVQGDRDLLRAALEITPERADQRTFVLALRANKVGHAVPTGDMFRRIEVRARLDAGPSARSVVLARRFRITPTDRGPTRIQVGDDRVPANGDVRRVELRFPEEIAGRDVLWQVVYQRMDADMAELFGVDSKKDEIVLAEGTWQAKKKVER